MKILHVTASHAKADGGVTTVVNDLVHNISRIGAYSCILAATDEEEFAPEGVDFVKAGSGCNKFSALFSSEIKESIRRIIEQKKISVIHIHGVWRPLQVVASRVAKEMGIPFIVTSHGMLEPWLWTGKGLKGWLKKKIYFHLISYPAFKYAQLIHAITDQESKNLRLLFSDNKHVIVPNVIDFDLNIVSKQGEMRYEKVFLYIGRINPKKGIDILLEAFHKSDLSLAWTLVIAGPEEVPEYVIQLREFISTNGLESKVKFIGLVYGDEKENLYRSSWVTVAPSFSEVVGMVNLESAVYQTPSITTFETGLWDWEKGGGMLVHPNVDELSKALQCASQWSEIERVERGRKSYDFVKNNYSWDAVLPQWDSIYSSVASE